MLADVVPLMSLAVLLVVAYLSPRWWIEAGAALLAAAAVLASGAIGTHAAMTETRQLWPVVAFLIAILVVAESCRANGLFDAVGARLRRFAADQNRLLLVTFAVATVVTVVLSLDATVVLLTPVVLAVTASRFLPGELACVRLANSASLLIPVANLTNLLAVPRLHLTFGHFALIMVIPWLVVLAVEYAALRWVAVRHPLDESPAVSEQLDTIPAFPVTVVAAMLAGFAIASPYGVEPAWVATAAAALLVTHDLLRRRTSPPDVVRSANLSFAVFVLGLGVVVAGLGHGWFGDQLARLVPHRTDLLGLLAVAAIGAVIANLVNNLPATLLLVPLIAPLGTTPLLALLIGVNVGSSLTWTGSLANLLWRRVLLAQERPVPTRLFHLVSAVTCPIAIVAGVVALDGWSRLVG